MEIQRKHILIILLVSFIARLAILFGTNLGVDEAYYFSYALVPKWSYFDHPPMVSWIILLTTFNLNFTGEFFMRLGPLLLGTGNLYVLYLCGRQLRNKQTGIVAMLFGSLSIYNSIVSGVFILPDASLAFFWLTSLLFVLRWMSTNKQKYLMLFGVSAGLAMLSKYAAVFLWIGLLSFILVDKREQLKNKFLYISLLVSVLLFAPVLLWNSSNQMESFAFHVTRFSFKNIHIQTLLTEAAGQLGYNNPINVLAIFVGIFHYRKKKTGASCCSSKLLLLMGLPLILSILVFSIFNQTLPHWSAPGYYSLILLVSLQMSDIDYPATKLKRWLYSSASVLVMATIFSIALIHKPGTMVESKLPDEVKGKGDITLDVYGYQQMGEKVAAWIDSCQQLTGDQIDLITRRWYPGGHLLYYAAYPNNCKLYVTGTRNEMHHFAQHNLKLGPIKQGCNACYITLSQYNKPLPIELADRFERVGIREEIPIFRDNTIVYFIFLTPLVSAKTDIDLNEIIFN